MSEEEQAQHEVEPRARELAHESTQEEFLSAFELGATCERCGRGGLDDDGYTDCSLVPDPADANGPWVLLCASCLTAAHNA